MQLLINGDFWQTGSIAEKITQDIESIPTEDVISYDKHCTEY
jgi:hypothetical protein